MGLMDPRGLARNEKDAQGRPMCGARVRNARHDGETCRNRALGPVLSTGFRRCRMHGGFVDTGPAAVGYKTGLYSKHMPAPLKERYERHLANPEILSLRDDVAAVTAKIEEAIAGVTAGAAVQLPPLLQAFEAAVAAKDQPRIVATFDALKAGVKGAVGEAQAWQQVMDLQRHKARLARVEHQRVVAAATMIDAASAWALTHAILELINANVPDSTARHAIADGLVRIVGPGAISRADAGRATG